ncbi:thiopeptide-type bacteriocin biosynthesis protein [Sphingobacterium sp. KU25419]|nr:thiopeptide-type bacteriocin biosynthesis protein [Sphingobacterium sp. KU25419]
MKKWFFIRYNDPTPHIRFRIELRDQNMYVKVVSEINKVLGKFVESEQISKISFDTYSREIERYTLHCMEKSEELFYIESELVLKIIKNAKSNLERWKKAFEYIVSILNQAGLQLVEKKDFCERMFELYHNEFGNDQGIIIHFNQKFKELKFFFKTLEDNSCSSELFVELCSIQHEIFSKTKSTNAPQKSSEITNKLLSSYIHMFLNRNL